jgi:hypothetical protein
MPWAHEKAGPRDVLRSSVSHPVRPARRISRAGVTRSSGNHPSRWYDWPTGSITPPASDESVSSSQRGVLGRAVPGTLLDAARQWRDVVG